jgi:hypothetical protein
VTGVGGAFNGTVSLAAGNIAEQAGAWVLRADAPTQWLASHLHALLF